MIKKFHQLVTEFIVLVPHVLKEIRNKSDEIAHAHQVTFTKTLIHI